MRKHKYKKYGKRMKAKKGQILRFKNILIIDDAKCIRDIFSHLLSRYDYDIQLAKSNDEALTFLEMDQFDLIMADVKMPGMPIEAFLNTIKSSKKWMKIPVLVITAVPDAVNQSIRSMIHGFLKKPFPPEILLNSVRSLI